MTTSSQSFGRTLRSHRERRGISIEAIAESTKIKASLLRELERDDVSRWPKAIFRRAFIREYAAAIGLDPETVVAEFVTVFPEPGDPAAPPRLSVESSGGLRLTFAEDDDPRLSSATVRVIVATLEASAIAAIGVAVAWVTSFGTLAVCGGLAMTYYPIASACFGRSPALRWLHGSTPPPVPIHRPAEDDEAADLWRLAENL